jgi:hypothetical protein
VKGTFDVDPAQCDYGPPTASVRRILSTWMAIDWFVPPGHAANQSLATKLLAQYNARARAQSPDAFPAELTTRAVWGGWGEFAALCNQVKTQGWDWRYGALKPLSSAHSKARGWSPEASLRRAAPRDPAQPYGPGDLFWAYGDQVIWRGLNPKFAPGDALPRDRDELASWYVFYASVDGVHCVEWQLAEDNSDLKTNPFFPLVCCYAAGFYPFSLDRSTIVLFAFTE